VWGSKFKAVVIDYPWAIEMRMKKNNKETLFLGYDTIPDSFLDTWDLSHIQDQGYLFFWTVNSKLTKSIEFLLRQGYR
jgi:N6-adenosine-specific RNA methylase IME4